MNNKKVGGRAVWVTFGGLFQCGRGEDDLPDIEEAEPPELAMPTSERE